MSKVTMSEKVTTSEKVHIEEKWGKIEEGKWPSHKFSEDDIKNLIRDAQELISFGYRAKTIRETLGISINTWYRHIKDNV